jgi:hypothetical protein
VLGIRDVLLGSGSDHFLILDPDLNIFILDPGSYMKMEYKLTRYWYPYFFLASYAFRSKVLVKKIRDPEKIHPGSGSWIQGAKKHQISDPDPQHCYKLNIL